MGQRLGLLKEILAHPLRRDRSAPPNPGGGCVLFHAINGIGLGHVSRLVAIAFALRELSPSTDLLFAVEGNSHGLLEAAKLPRVTFPAAPHIFSEPSDSWPRPRVERLIRSMAESITEVAGPNLIVFDCFPNRALVEVARRKGIPFAMCVRASKDMDHYFEGLKAVLREADVIIIPHHPGEISVPADLAGKTHFVGSIVRPVAETPGRAGPSEQRRLVLISGGGGGYPGTVDFYNFALEATAKCREAEPELSALLVTGPLFHEWGRLKPVSGVRIIPFDPYITNSFRRSSLVVCQAGYNTVAEIVSAGVPAICVPAERKFDDQHERARATSAAHQQFHLWEGQDSESLSSLMLRLLRAPRTDGHAGADSKGSTLAAEILIESMARNR